jgi:hypothetical protein
LHRVRLEAEMAHLGEGRMDFSRLLRAFIYGVILLAWANAWAAPACAQDAKRAPGRARNPRPFVKPYHDGFVLVLWNEYSEAELSGLLDRIRSTGSDSLELPLFGCQSTIHSSDVGDCEPSNRPIVLRVARAAVAKGFSVTILPIVITPQWDWRGLFEPTDVAGWFRTYTAWMDRVARDAIDIGSPELIAGTEFKALYKYGNGKLGRDELHLLGSGRRDRRLGLFSALDSAFSSAGPA